MPCYLVLAVACVIQVHAGAPGNVVTVVQGSPPPVSVSESTLRSAATSSQMPRYPAQSIERKSIGVAVAEVTVTEEGRVATVNVLQAPDADIATSVRDALARWAFTPVQVSGRSSTSPMRGKLTFYFRLLADKGNVTMPELPGAGPRDRPHPPGGTPRGQPPGRAPLPVSPPVYSSAEFADAVSQVTEAEFSKMAATERPLVVDIGDREAFRRRSRKGAVNIPFDELDSRAPSELPREKRLVIDCSQEEVGMCRHAAERLRSLSFSHVSLLVR
jgi:TonB family protein